ncbi:polysaccharide deacetylase family protein [Actinacidiphila acididurans]|uniref:Polysaccharide deacetylase family protein n=1 Tax=Actinacidiphila acididurans TaxID=2784346 RepID=A0ABS2U0J7_9ACTN|nr:polysaccharide deacetylase family protein [Actinacidiphila acididurans]MBM9507728.1 polysaccharide deacetylase family protein [Actinacidiphila acididurans]
MGATGGGDRTGSRKRRAGRSVAAVAVAVCVAVGVSGSGAAYGVTSARGAREAAFKVDNGKGGERNKAPGSVDCRKAKCIALTFDSAPSAHTAALLRILERKKVRATFFLLGHRHVDAYPGLVKRMAADGHVLANHTWTHPRLPSLTPAQIRAQLTMLNDAVQKLTGIRPTLMRPPQGRTDQKVAQVCRELGLAQVLWSDSASDYATTDTPLIRQRILSGASRGGIVLLHDLYQGTVPAVPGIIDGLRRQGYTFVTVPELLAPAVPQPGAVYR